MPSPASHRLISSLTVLLASASCSPFPDFHIVECLNDSDCDAQGMTGSTCDPAAFVCRAPLVIHVSLGGGASEGKATDGTPSYGIPSDSGSPPPISSALSEDAGADVAASPEDTPAPDVAIASDADAGSPLDNLFHDPRFDEDSELAAWRMGSYLANSTLSWFEERAALLQVSYAAEMWSTQLNQFRIVESGERFTVSFQVRALGPLGTTKTVGVHIIEEGLDYTIFAYKPCQVDTHFSACSVTGTVTQGGLIKFGLQGGNSDVDFVVDDAVLVRH